MAQRDQSTESRAFGTFGISAAEQPRMPKASGIVGQEVKTFRRSHYYGSYQAVKRPSGKILSMALAMLALTGPLRAQTLTPVYDFALPVGHAYAIGLGTDGAELFLFTVGN
jgi:hypothetical protein